MIAFLTPFLASLGVPEPLFHPSPRHARHYVANRSFAYPKEIGQLTVGVAGLEQTDGPHFILRKNCERDIIAALMRAMPEFVVGIFLWRGPPQMKRVYTSPHSIAARVGGFMNTRRGRAVSSGANKALHQPMLAFVTHSCVTISPAPKRPDQAFHARELENNFFKKASGCAPKGASRQWVSMFLPPIPMLPAITLRDRSLAAIMNGAYALISHVVLPHVVVRAARCFQHRCGPLSIVQ